MFSKQSIGYFFLFLIFCQNAAFAAEIEYFKIDNVGSAAECETCVSFIGQAINQLLNIILNVGVLGSCGSLCGMLPNQLEQVVCNLACDYVGIEAFVDLINYEDPDPIYICEEVTMCPIKDNAAGKINSVTITPAVGHQGDTFTIVVDFTITNATGTGELAVDVFPPEGFPFGDGELMVQTPPGRYGAKLQFEAKPNQEEPFMPGTYTVEAALCEGSCGSIHPHSYLMAKGKGTFKIQ
eukprot:TRINITY_DN10559_c0_g1_i1.p1 TRINITY_DN10559_c0_g1~~TRINITY_DN10559_c0_g1_i1.p1  ORF type:complete len:238 (+),score=57.60 TRINITY_DN10559_c0_g1_i1:35-748(+)